MHPAVVDSSRKPRRLRKPHRLHYGSRRLTSVNPGMQRILRPMAEELRSFQEKPRLLLVEDRWEDAHLFEVALETANIEAGLTVLRTGKDAIRYFAQAATNGDPTVTPLPDILFLDLKLPDIPGLEVLEAIRSHPALDGLVTFALTGSQDDWDFYRANELLVDAFIPKPSTFEGLVRLVRDVDRNWLKP